MRHASMSTHSRGFGLFETILSLALAGVALTTMVWALVTPASATASIDEETRRLDQLDQNIHSAFAAYGDLAGVSTANSFRDGWVVPNVEPRESPWGGFDLQPAQTKAPNDSWQAIYSTVPQKPCVLLVSRELASTRWSSITVDEKQVSTMADVTSYCANEQTAGAASTHTLSFVRYGGPRAGQTSGLPLICWDRYRGDPRGYEPGCPTDPLAYRPRSS